MQPLVGLLFFVVVLQGQLLGFRAAFCDVRGSGSPDIVVVNTTHLAFVAGGDTSTSFPQSPGQMYSVVELPAVLNTPLVSCGSLEGSGRHQLVLADVGSTVASVWIWNGTGVTLSLNISSSVGPIIGLTVSNVQGRSNLIGDVVLAGKNQVALMEAGAPSSSFSCSFCGLFTSFASGDLNGDSIDEIVLLDSEGLVVVLGFANGSGLSLLFSQSLGVANIYEVGISYSPPKGFGVICVLSSSAAPLFMSYSGSFIALDVNISLVGSHMQNTSTPWVVSGAQMVYAAPAPNSAMFNASRSEGPLLPVFLLAPRTTATTSMFLLTQNISVTLSLSEAWGFPLLPRTAAAPLVAPLSRAYLSPYWLNFTCSQQLREAGWDVPPWNNWQLWGSVPYQHWFDLQNPYGVLPNASGMGASASIFNLTAACLRERFITAIAKFSNWTIGGFRYQHHHIPPFCPDQGSTLFPWNWVPSGAQYNGTDCSSLTGFGMLYAFGFNITEAIQEQSQYTSFPVPPNWAVSNVSAVIFQCVFGVGQIDGCLNVSTSSTAFGYNNLIEILQPGDLIYVSGNSHEVTHVLTFLGYVGGQNCTGSECPPLVLDSHDGVDPPIVDVNGVNVLDGPRIRPYDEKSWYFSSTFVVRRVVSDDGFVGVPKWNPLTLSDTKLFSVFHGPLGCQANYGELCNTSFPCCNEMLCLRHTQSCNSSFLEQFRCAQR